MSTYSELRQELDRIEKYIQDAIAKLVNTKEPTEEELQDALSSVIQKWQVTFNSKPPVEVREALRLAMDNQIKLRVDLSSLLEREAKEIAASADLDNIKFLYRGRRYSVSGCWHVYYEKCQVIERKPNYLTVVSQDMDVPGFYKGGKFRVKRDELQSNGKAYHSRHGEFFYIEPLSDSSPLPGSAVIGIGTTRSPEDGAMVLGTPHQLR
jgi:hypothetical protein